MIPGTHSGRMARKDDLGRRGKQLAVAHLEGLGLVVVDRNWRCALGEIDVVVRDGAEIVFVEVKTRSGLGFGHPFEAITPRKLARLRRLAGAWLAAHPGAGGGARLDAIAVIITDAVVIEHLRGIW